MNSGTCVGRAAAALGILAALTLAGCGLQPSDRLVQPVGPALSQALSADYTLEPTAPAAAAEIPAAPAAPTLGIIKVYAVDLRFVPKITSISTPGRYTVRLINTDELPHDISLPDGTRIYAAAGQTAEADFTIGDAGVSFICAVPGHREAGMVGQISIDSPVAAGPVAP